MKIFQQYMAIWLGLFVVYLAVGVIMEVSLHLFRGDWFRLMTLIVGMPTALVGGYALSRRFHKR
jgi:putative flippase GtrA